MHNQAKMANQNSLNMTKIVSPISTICARIFDTLIKLMMMMMMMIVITSFKIQNCIDTLKPFGSREVSSKTVKEILERN